MSEFTIRSESVDVEQIMKQIRARILEKRGADYTEDQIRELASVRLEKFLEPRNLRSDLLEQFRKSRPAINTEPAPITPPYTVAEADIYATHRGGLRFLRKIFGPLLKLMVNLNPLLHVIHKQAEFNVDLLERPLLRGAAQPGARNHPHGHRGPEPADAGRVAVEPPRLQRTPGPRARGRRAVPARSDPRPRPPRSG